MPITTEELQTRWSDGYEKGSINNFLSPVGQGKKAWVGQFLFDAGSWTLQMRPKDVSKFVGKHAEWMELSHEAAFRKIDGTVPLDEVCKSIGAAIATLEEDMGALEIIESD